MCMGYPKPGITQDNPVILSPEISRGKKLPGFLLPEDPWIFNNIPGYPEGFYFGFLRISLSEIYLRRA